MELALWADILIASETAVFAANFIEHGLTGGAVTYWRLPRLAGPSNAALLLLAAERIDAAAALAIGLVSRVVPPERLREEASQLAQKIASYSPRAAASIKAGLRLSVGGRQQDQRGVIEHANAALAEIFDGLRG
jgi:E-phenylitaconyl-CoA hydratase